MHGVTPTTAEMRGILAGRPQGCTQCWRYGLPSRRYVNEGDFRRERHTVIKVPEALARSFIERHHYLAGWPSALHRYGLWDHEPPQGEEGPGPEGAALADVLVLGYHMNEIVLTRSFPRLSRTTSARKSRGWRSPTTWPPSAASGGHLAFRDLHGPQYGADGHRPAG